MSMKKINILGTRFDYLTRAEAVDRIVAYLQSGNKASVFTPNPEIVIEAYRDAEFQEVLNKSEMTIPDGIGVVIGSRIIGRPLPERVAGYDTLIDVFGAIENSALKVFFLGSGPGVADEAKNKMLDRYPNLNIVGTHDGYFKQDDKVIDYINSFEPDMLLVGLGAPKQEKWIASNRDRLCATVLFGCGGALDGFSGRVERAPDIFIRLNLEWFYRLVSQPSRWRRMMRLPLFLMKMIVEGRRYPQE